MDSIAQRLAMMYNGFPRKDGGSNQTGMMEVLAATVDFLAVPSFGRRATEQVEAMRPETVRAGRFSKR